MKQDPSNAAFDDMLENATGAIAIQQISTYFVLRTRNITYCGHKIKLKVPTTGGNFNRPTISSISFQ